jgi:lysophospholipase L1-like esterase
MTALCKYVSAALSLILVATANAQEMLVKDGQKIAFLGDSITQLGMSLPSGYCRLVVSGLEANGLKVQPIGAGISGNTSKDMIARVDRDVIDKKPDIMTLSCGVNDVWHGKTGVELEPYKKNITDIIDKAQAAGIKVVVLASTMILEDAHYDNNKKLVAYNNFLRDIAKEKGCAFADLNADMQGAVKANGGGDAKHFPVLTVDGVHMNPLGNRMMARGVLKAFGLNETQIEKAEQAWLDIPAACRLDYNRMVTIRQYDLLNAAATKQNRPVNELLNELYSKAIDAYLANSAGQADASK